MKRISYLVLLAFISSLFLFSCSDTKTYAELIKDEKTAIDNYLKRNNIRVIKTLPAKDAWGANDYYLTNSGLYFHLVKPGLGDTVKVTNLVIPRFVQKTLDLVPVVVSNWSTVDFPYPTDFVFGNTSESCAAFHEAASLMQSNDSEARIIVPSGIGFNENMMTVTPMFYDLKINFLK